jgi:hypothetical protein
LNGEYKWYSRKGILVDWYYLNGQRIWRIVYYHGRADTKRKKYAYVSSLDFRNKYKGEPFTATRQYFLKDGWARKLFLSFDTVTWSYNEGIFY